MLGQATPTPTPVGEPIINISGMTAVWLVVGIAVGLVLLWAIPLYLESRRAYKAYKHEQVPLIRDMLKSAEDGTLDLTPEQMGELVTASTRRFEGGSGTARALMAFAVISILGVALIAVLLSSAGDATDLRKTIITALLSILGTIVGFYFGARTVETGIASGQKAQEKDAVLETSGQENSGQAETPVAPEP
jgi:hypothetical protein